MNFQDIATFSKDLAMYRWMYWPCSDAMPIISIIFLEQIALHAILINNNNLRRLISIIFLKQIAFRATLINDNYLNIHNTVVNQDGLLPHD